MKSQHRHELQTNELGKFAGSIWEKFERYSNQIMIGVCVLSLGVALVVYKVRSDRIREASAWRDLANARKPDDYLDVWKTHGGTTAALWARVHEGEGRLGEGVQLMFSNVESGTKEIKLAQEALQEVVDQKGAPAELRERALFALAHCLESLSTGDESSAVKTYEALLREFPATMYKADAELRIAALGSGSGQEFYAWFSKYPRPKPSEKRPRDRVEDGAADDLGNLLDEADLESSATGAPKMEEDEDAANPANGAASSEKAAPEDRPAPDAESPTDSPPAKPESP